MHVEITEIGYKNKRQQTHNKIYYINGLESDRGITRHDNLRRRNTSLPKKIEHCSQFE